MTNFKEFAALANQKKKRGVPGYGKTAYLKSRPRNFDKGNQIIHIPLLEPFPATFGERFELSRIIETFASNS